MWMMQGTYLLSQTPGSEKGGHTKPVWWQCREHSLQLSITPCKHLHKDAEIFNVHLKGSSGGALSEGNSEQKSKHHWCKQILSLTNLFRAFSCECNLKSVVNRRHPSKKKGIFNSSGISTVPIPMPSQSQQTRKGRTLTQAMIVPP